MTVPRVHTKIIGMAGPQTWEVATRCPEHTTRGGPSPRVGALQRPRETGGGSAQGSYSGPLLTSPWSQAGAQLGIPAPPMLMATQPGPATPTPRASVFLSVKRDNTSGAQRDWEDKEEDTPVNGERRKHWLFSCPCNGP